MRKKKKSGYVFLGVSSSRKEKKKICVKNEKKWCRNLLGYCPTVSQYNGELYRDTAAGRAVGWGEGHDTVGCIVTGAEVWLGKLLHDTNFVLWLGG